MNYRLATETDCPVLAQMNRELIQDEGHRNRMTVPELQRRMLNWLKTGEYQAVLFECNGQADGYALFRREKEFIYLRQFFVRRQRRRNGIGKAAIAWLRTNLWKESQRVRLDVLVGNHVGREFWRSVGFHDYCLTMELEFGEYTTEPA